MLMVENRVAADFEGTTYFVITDPAFVLAGNTALLMDDFRGCETC
ncbi:hypothetical protein C5S36_01175 [Candidatus Methanophagaceae archaeon]|nr:hypothetical protein C5S36_01175 [Methanophagales archaeon]